MANGMMSSRFVWQFSNGFNEKSNFFQFIQPLEALQAFDMKRFRYSILKHKFIELLCIKSEAGGALIAAGQGLNSVDGAVEEVVQVLEELEKLAPTKDEYSGLCLLLTLPRLADHLQYRNWNPSFSRYTSGLTDLKVFLSHFQPYLECNVSKTSFHWLKNSCRARKKRLQLVHPKTIDSFSL